MGSLNMQSVSEAIRRFTLRTYEQLGQELVDGPAYCSSKATFASWRSGRRSPGDLRAEDLFSCWLERGSGDGSSYESEFNLKRLIAILDEIGCFPEGNAELERCRTGDYKEGDFHDFSLKLFTLAIDGSRTKTSNARKRRRVEKHQSIPYDGSKYLDPKFYALLSSSEEEYERAVDDCCRLYALSATVESNYSVTIEGSESFNRLLSRVLRSKSSSALKIQGPIGSDGTNLLQLLFVGARRLTQREKGEKPALFYINLCAVEEVIEEGPEPFDAQVKRSLDAIVKPFVERVTKQGPNAGALIFVDGVKGYQWGLPAIDYYLKTILSKIPKKSFAISVDTFPVDNPSRMRNGIPLAPKSFDDVICISPLSLFDKKLVLDYLGVSSKVYDIHPPTLLAELSRMSFHSLSSAQIRILGKAIEDMQAARLEDGHYNISDLYEGFCLDYFNGDTRLLSEAASAAYELAYTDVAFETTDTYTKPYWKLMREDSSFIDYFVSLYYMRMIKEYKSGDPVDQFDIIFPKTVTRFITGQINSSSANEFKVLSLIKERYHEMGTRGKSEMTYWLGRIRSPRLQEEATQILIELEKEALQEYEEKKRSKNGYQYRDKKEDVFLIRGISVSLIYQQVPGASDEYIATLIKDDLANTINRGFHLEYYGDKDYLPSYNTLNYEDDLSVGESTIKQLLASVEDDLSCGRKSVAYDLNLFTVCSLIQARIEQYGRSYGSSFAEYVRRVLLLVENRQGSKNGPFSILDWYFFSIQEDFSGWISGRFLDGKGVSAYLLQTFGTSPSVDRTGWVKHGIPNPESIVEHSFNCWLMGVLFLPAEYPSQTDYSKETILSMLLIHDLGEYVTGDIEKTQKANDRSYQCDENLVMSSFLIKGTYPETPNLYEYFSLWHEWEERATYNSRVAKDIDIVQAVYQLCTYLLQYRDNFTEEKMRRWISERRDLTTDLGRQIYDKAITGNSRFKELDIPGILQADDHR